MQVSKKSYELSALKLLIRGLFLLVVWSLISSMWRGYVQTKKGFSRLSEIEVRTSEVLKENEELKQKLEQVKSEEYRYKIVREKLRMQKPDEIVVVLPDKQNVMGYDVAKSLSNWQKWLRLLTKQ